MSKLVYNESFYRSQSERSSYSANVVVPILIDLVHPASVIDIGCGVGTWLQAFNNLGVTDILGVDGHYVNRSMLRIPERLFLARDLSEPFIAVGRRFDMAMCLEVAEHIAESQAADLIHTLTALAPVVFFSAAIPGQGGFGHVNEQWPDYWIDLFDKQDYEVLDVIRPRIWNDTRIEPWYSQNAFLFLSKAERHAYPGMRMDVPIQLSSRVIHPELFRRFLSLEYVSARRLCGELVSRIQRKLMR
jgi:hypothetical protein